MGMKFQYFMAWCKAYRVYRLISKQLLMQPRPVVMTFCICAWVSICFSVTGMKVANLCSADFEENQKSVAQYLLTC